MVLRGPSKESFRHRCHLHYFDENYIQGWLHFSSQRLPPFSREAITLIDPAVRGRHGGLQRHGSFEYILSNLVVKKKRSQLPVGERSAPKSEEVGAQINP
jgi:hypothetical protein